MSDVGYIWVSYVKLDFVSQNRLPDIGANVIILHSLTYCKCYQMDLAKTLLLALRNLLSPSLLREVPDQINKAVTHTIVSLVDIFGYYNLSHRILQVLV